MKDDQIAYSVGKLKEHRIVTGGDAANMGIGIMTDARWKNTYEYMVAAELLKRDVDVRQAYTLQFVKDLRVMP